MTHSSLLSWAFYGPFLVAILYEAFAERRPATAERPRRWLANISLGLGNLAIRQAVVASGAYLAAIEAARADFGLLNQLALPPLVGLPLPFVLLDFVEYWQHRLFHAVPLLWRIHAVHHSDVECDFTTSLRHHPLEIVVQFALTTLAVTLLGVPPDAVAVFALLSLAHDRFQHANVRVPARLDAALRSVVVTPDYHVVHHSSRQRQTDSNYGSMFSWWDRMFGTRCIAGRDEIRTMQLGLESLRSAGELWPHRVLSQPFRV